MILGGIFDLEEKKNRIKELEEEQTKEDFWQNIDRANEVNKELSNLKKELNLYSDLNKQINEGLELLNSDVDNDIILLISEELSTLSSK